MNEEAPADGSALRPRDFALLLLASGELAPRQRARDQQADRAGLELKRRVLQVLAERDPEPEGLEAALLAVVEGLGPPTGPTRAVARALLEDWRSAAAAPGLIDHLLGQALHPPTAEGRRGGQLPA